MFIVSWRTLGKEFLQLLPGVPCKPLPCSLSEERKIPHENACSENLLSLQQGPKAFKQELYLHQGLFASGHAYPVPIGQRSSMEPQNP